MGILGCAMAMRFVPQQASPERRAFDTLGLILTASASAGLIGGLDLISSGSDQWVYGGRPLIGSVGLGWLAIRHARSKIDPVVSLAARRTPTFFAANI